METKSNPWVRLSPWLLLLLSAFAFGRWQGASSARQPAPASTPVAKTEPPSVDSAVAAQEKLQADLDQIVVAAQKQLQPDARTLGFFEKLTAEDVAHIADRLEKLPSSNERDLLFLMAMRRWGELAGAAAVERANGLENLPLRAAARAAAYEAWGVRDAPTAFAHAMLETPDGDRDRALTALLAGAAVAYPGGAITWWESAPETFRGSPAGHNALERITEAACGTGRRDAMEAIVIGLPPGNERALLTAAVARQWGRHDPEAAVTWLKSVTPAGEVRDGMVDEVFSAFVRKNPVHAADWAARQTDERRRTNYVAAAVSEWATYDSASAETWVNEQPEGVYLDGATYAIAAHFIERRHLPQAFAWTRRIMRNEARADLLGNLGRIWNSERPEEFNTFLAQTSLNRAELEMLRSKIIEVPAPAQSQ